MSTSRLVILGLIVIGLGIGLFSFKAKEQKAERLRDYANVMTDTHTKAIAEYDEADTTARRLNSALASGAGVPVEEVEEAVGVFRGVAKNTRKLKEELSLVIPPPGAEGLRDDGLTFLEARAQLADLTADFLTEIAKQVRGQDVSDRTIQGLYTKMAAKKKEVDGMTKDLRDKKDKLIVP